MIRLQYSEHLQRKIRQDDPQYLSMPSWTLLREAILAGRTDEALDFLADGKVGAKTMHDLKRGENALLLTYIADTFGEEQIEKYWKREVHTSNWLAQKYSVEDDVQIPNPQSKVATQDDDYLLKCA